ncbi:D-alanyl-D-alanine carboxypeptidase [Oceanobacillus limi]|uniref:D-alanyl-D-alanine carboxypeptidase n=1 Tax=Oceanobacillus limi TaxID=930131 RepID=A0A1I0BJE2_9BACI|nr:serine hydrolase domain-containing protein [Oceanobacillus limi]SET07113.1 D-alanyl-D-alanine carboxypeptidase [Oceanobacillus limi]
MVNEKFQLLESQFRKMVQNDKNIRNAYLLVHSENQGLHVNLAEGNTGEMKATSNQAFFGASIGKMFTAVIVAMLVEKGKISYEDNITQYLDGEIVKDLHVYNGTDYTGEIQVKHLLNHTSGIHDYFEDKPKQGKPMLDHLLEEPSHFWTPKETIQWSKENLESHFAPGDGFHYSDTGYHLLGLIIERVTSMAFHRALIEYIFEPLNMQHSYLLHYSDPVIKNEFPPADVYIKDTNVISYPSLGIDYAGGGIVAPAKDLLKFMKAVKNHELISKESFEAMHDWAKFAPGIDYGYGIMKFTPTPVVLPKKYAMWGNAGITGSFMFYHPELETYIIGSLNNFLYHRKGVKLVFKVIDGLMK